MCGCGCITTLTSTKGEKGDPGPTGDAGGMVRGIIPGTSSEVALTLAQTGGTLYFDRAAGVVATLPASPTAGTFYNFEVKTSVTSNSLSIVSGAAFMDGNIIVKSIATTEALFEPLGTDRRISMNGTTTGGLIGTSFSLTYDGAAWVCSGLTVATGALATPFAA